jgi:hypothetical protein
MTTKASVVLPYKAMSAEDQRTFWRWVTANVFVVSMLAVGLAAMAMGDSSGSADQRASVANHTASTNLAGATIQ